MITYPKYFLTKQPIVVGVPKNCPLSLCGIRMHNYSSVMINSSMLHESAISHPVTESVCMFPVDVIKLTHVLIDINLIRAYSISYHIS